jgi:hypothetical protein
VRICTVVGEHWTGRLSKREQLLNTLAEAESLLRSHGEEHWASWLRRDAALIRASDGFGLEHLLRAFGGMGSFNDLIRNRPATAVLTYRVRDYASPLRAAAPCAVRGGRGRIRLKKQERAVANEIPGWNEDKSAALLSFARRYIWWLPAEEAGKRPRIDVLT